MQAHPTIEEVAVTSPVTTAASPITTTPAHRFQSLREDRKSLGLQFLIGHRIYSLHDSSDLYEDL